jgi:hypothetical protein
MDHALANGFSAAGRLVTENSSHSLVIQTVSLEEQLKRKLFFKAGTDFYGTLSAPQISSLKKFALLSANQIPWGSHVNF